MAGRLEPNEAAGYCSQAAVILTQAMVGTENASVRLELTRGLVAVAVHLEPREAIAALNLAMIRVMDKNPSDRKREFLSELTLSEVALLTGYDRRTLVPRAASAVLACSFANQGQPLSALTLSSSVLEPSPRRLSTQECVDLLKQPTCIGPARRVILDQLENRYHRKFADHWAFVRFAQEEKLGLDFTSPPKRIGLGVANREN